MNKRFFYWFIISIAAVQLFAVETVRFQEQTYSGSVTYNEKAQPGDAVFVRLSMKVPETTSDKTSQKPIAVLQLFKGKERAASTQFFFTNPQNRSAETAEMLAGIPLSTWLSGEETYSLKVIISTGDAQKKEITLPFSIQKKQFVSERIVLDARNTGIRKDVSPERRAQSEKLNKILETVIPQDVYTLKPFTIPVDSKRITSGFGDRRVFEYTDKKTSTSLHYGIDYGVPTGTPVHSCAEGKVVLAENRISTGWSVVVEHLPGLYSLYYHMDSLNVQEGQYVKQGEKLGLSGATGLATGPHLHWEVRLNMGAVNPEFFLKEFAF
ncbi:M23 family metallopeptidase [uncultured Treponema sp.]|uniref:M23 family metallopeptidase n=1 Tax=uncultured Treponema sp. TaxID=162155 RepID=UPI0028E702F0|nr:M23 family metallopeptidase [uncultured Treponema sp.]